MKLAIYGVEGKGDLHNESVWLDVTEDIANLSYYMLCDTTYTDNVLISNELRHMYWFRKNAVTRGDWIRLMTKSGTNTTATNNRGTTTHILYWGLGRTVWNKAGDGAILFEINTWKATKA